MYIKCIREIKKGKEIVKIKFENIKDLLIQINIIRM